MGLVENLVCVYEGCNRKRRNKGYSSGGKRIYGLYCERHHKFRCDGKTSASAGWIQNDSCELCGWDKAPCDRHRKNPTLPYKSPGNTQILCPNCHRIESIRQESERKQTA